MTPEEIELLSELTIVIPTYNRPLELERSIEYWRDTPVTVHILDGSDKPWFPVGILPGTSNITYHHFNPRVDQLLSENYKARIRFGVQLPETRYSALIGDDDFFTISGLNACLKVLKINSEVCSVIGYVAGYEINKGATLWGIREVVRNYETGFQSGTVRERLEPFQSNVMPKVYYGIYRTEFWKKTFGMTFEHNFRSNLLGGERLLYSVAAALGPILKHGQLTLVRKFYVERINLEFFDDGRGKYERYLNDRHNRDEVNVLFGALASAIQCGTPNFSPRKAMRLAKKVLKPGFRVTENGFKYRLRKKLARTLVRLGANISPKLRLSLNRSMSTKLTRSLGFVEVDQKLKPALGRQDLNTFLQRLADTEVVYDEFEIRKVNELLLKPREELRLRANI